MTRQDRARRAKPHARHRSGEAWKPWLAKKVCRVLGHDEEKVSTGDRVCYRCETTLGRWRS